jgi:iron complex outermembrane receptor protein
LYNVEQVEVLKGPASVLYGSADPGGVINLVSRKPQQEQSSEWDAAYGSFDLYRIHNHSTGPMTDDPELLYLLDVGYENAGSFRDNVETENIQITPGFSWIPNNACRIDFEFGYIHDRRDGQSDRGIPAVNGLYFVLPDSFNSNEPWDYTQTAAYYGEAHLRLDMTDSLSLYSGIRAFTSKNEQHFHFPGTLDTRTWMLPRTFSESWDDQDGIANDTHILWKAGGDGIENQVLFGIETSCGSDDRRTQSASAGVSSLYIWDPVYDADSAGYVFGAPSRLNSEMLRCGGYLHDELTLQRRLHLLAGCRYDRYETEQIDPTGATPAYEDDGDSPTFNGGALYDLVKESKASLNDLSVYASYGECYQPQSQPRYAPGTPAAVRSETFDPLTGWQVESGVKGAWLENKLTTTLALFHIAQKNILTVDPTDPTGYTYDTIGAQESDGLEVEVAGRLTKAWSVSANYAYTDATITEDSRPANVGKRLPNVAKNQAGLWSRCDIGGTGFAVMGGVTYVGEREPFTGFAGDPYPAYTTVDVGASYVFKRVTLGAGLNNVFDEDIALGGRGAYGYMPGAPRNFLLTAKVTL